MQSRDLSGSALSVNDRRSCVEYLSAEGYSAAEIAGILSVADRTVLRDRQAIKEKNALGRDPALAGQVAGQLIREADSSMGRLRKLARDREAPHAARVEAERSAFGIFRDMVRTLQRLGYLPEAETRFSGDLTHRLDPHDSTPPDYEELRLEVERIEAIRQRHPPPPGSSEPTLRSSDREHAGAAPTLAPNRNGSAARLSVIPLREQESADIDDELARVKHLLTSLAAMDATRKLAERLAPAPPAAAGGGSSHQSIHDTDDTADDGGEDERSVIATTNITHQGKEA